MQIPGLPAPPTDNSYKFKALAGLWLVAGTLTGIGIGSFEVLREIHEAKMQLVTLEIDEGLLEQDVTQDSGQIAELKSTENALDRLAATAKETNAATDRYIQVLEKKAAAHHATKDEIDEAKRQIDSAAAQQDSLNRVANEARTKLETIEKNIEGRRPSAASLRKRIASLKVVVEWIRDLFRGLIMLMAVGVAMILSGLRLAETGFHQWRALQKIQDDVLRQQLSGPEQQSGREKHST